MRIHTRPHRHPTKHVPTLTLTHTLTTYTNANDITRCASGSVVPKSVDVPALKFGPPARRGVCTSAFSLMIKNCTNPIDSAVDSGCRLLAGKWRPGCLLKNIPKRYIHTSSLAQAKKAFLVPDDIVDFTELEAFFGVTDDDTIVAKPYDLDLLSNRIYQDLISPRRETEVLPTTRAGRRVLEEVKTDYWTKEQAGKLTAKVLERFIKRLVPHSFHYCYKYLVELVDLGEAVREDAFSWVLISALPHLNEQEIDGLFGVDTFVPDFSRSEVYTTVEKVLQMMEERKVPISVEFYLALSGYDKGPTKDLLYSSFLRYEDRIQSVEFYNFVLNSLYPMKDKMKIDRVFEKLYQYPRIPAQIISKYISFLVAHSMLAEAKATIDKLVTRYPQHRMLFFRVTITELISAGNIDVALSFLVLSIGSNAYDPGIAHKFYDYFIKTEFYTEKEEELRKHIEPQGFPRFTIDYHFCFRYFSRADPTLVIKMWKRFTEQRLPYTSLILNAFLLINNDLYVSSVWRNLLTKIPLKNGPFPVRVGGVAEILEPHFPIISQCVARLEMVERVTASSFKLLLQMCVRYEQFELACQIYDIAPLGMTEVTKLHYLTALKNLPQLTGRDEKVKDFIRRNKPLPHNIQKILIKEWPHLYP
eukprot:TRINITY_DN3079_c0_g1_i1.p1 TRINITY_DN3079_c0_g1~~TRINITY_DN3079_c0_g1_i1.p1  ORF type:complete len:643 (-),score=57.35 TRINITY_DN3079_c0_g1_i1:1-1929(-)